MSKTLSAKEIFELSKAFHDLSTVLGNYRYDHWGELTAAQRSELENQQWTLFNTASDLNASSVLAKTKLLDDEIAMLLQSSAAMQAAARKIQDIKHAINIATKAVALGGAIYVAASTGNVASLLPAMNALLKEIGA